MYVKIYSLINDDYCDKICNLLDSRNGVNANIKVSHLVEKRS